MNHWFNAKVIASIPIFIAVNLAVIAIWYFDISEQSMPLVLGIIAGGLVDLIRQQHATQYDRFYK